MASSKNLNSGFEIQGSAKTRPESTLTLVEEEVQKRLEEDGAEDGGSVAAEAFRLRVEGDGIFSGLFRVVGRRTTGLFSGGLAVD